MNPNLSPEGREACLYVLGRGLVMIRAALWSGEATRAEAIADALHNLPQLVAEGDRFGWTIREFRRLFLTDLVARYPDLAEWDRRLRRFDEPERRG